jgi:hypothetical protein
MIPGTNERVPLHTAEHLNRRLQRQLEENVARSAEAGPAAIDRRLAELDQEWDIERALEANAATVALAGLILGTAGNRKLLVLPALVAGFLLLHAVQGWCPPVGLFRRLGFRTAAEIDQERYALKILRGDFQNLPATPHASDRAPVSRILHAVQR